MNTLFKFLTVLFFTCSLSSAFARGNCVGKADAHENFCSSKSKHLCGVHSGVCSWERAKRVRRKIKDRYKACSAKAGKEVHENFCKNHNHQTCNTHSALCSWN